MYQLPEYKEGQEYWTVVFGGSKYSVAAFHKFHKDFQNEYRFNELKNEFNIFGTSEELAQIEADRRNALNKLKNLAREREKEFPIDWDNTDQGKYRFYFSWNHMYDRPKWTVKPYFRDEGSEIYFIFDYPEIEEAEAWLGSALSWTNLKSRHYVCRRGMCDRK